MDERPEVPDPQHDRFVAFPDEPAAPPPESWWTPNPPPPPPPPVVWHTPQPRRRPRRSGAWWAVVAVFLFGGMLSNHGSTSSDSGFGDTYAPGGVSLVAEATAPGGMIGAAEPTLYGIPPGTTSFRVEAVGPDSGAGIDITSQGGGPLLTSAEKLPYAGLLTRGDPEEALTITVLSAHSGRKVQCRVYLDDRLVAFGSGDGTATCELPAMR